MKYRPSPRVILAITIAVGVVVLGISVGDFVDVLQSGKLFAAPALAETAAAASHEAPADNHADKPSEQAAPNTDIINKDTPAPDAEEKSPAELDLLKQLSNRRQELEKRAHDLDTRETMMQVAEKRVEQKIADLENLKKQLQGMVNQANENQAAQLENLVKIYETMKPKEAARIFENLDMPVLLSVIQRMKPARTALVMAELNPDKAKEITMALTRQDKLPPVK